MRITKWLLFHFNFTIFFFFWLSRNIYLFGACIVAAKLFFRMIGTLHARRNGRATQRKRGGERERLTTHRSGRSKFKYFNILPLEIENICAKLKIKFQFFFRIFPPIPTAPSRYAVNVDAGAAVRKMLSSMVI